MVATKKYTYGLGRRKSATATVRLYKGSYNCYLLLYIFPRLHMLDIYWIK